MQVASGTDRAFVTHEPGTRIRLDCRRASSPESACDLRMRLPCSNTIRRQVCTDNPTEVLIIGGLGEVVICTRRHGDQILAKVPPSFGILRTGEQAQRWNVLSRCGRVVACKAAIRHFDILLAARFSGGAMSGETENRTGTFYISEHAWSISEGHLNEPRMEGMGTEAFVMEPYASWLPNQVPWRRSSGPVRRTASSETSICSLAPSHHGEAGAARPSSAEARFFSG